MKPINNTNIGSKLAATSALALVLVALALFTTAESHSGTPTLSDQLLAQRIVGSYLADGPDGCRILLNLNLGGSSHPGRARSRRINCRAAPA